MQQWIASLPEDATIVYIGDGGNDLCPIEELRRLAVPYGMRERRGGLFHYFHVCAAVTWPVLEKDTA